MLASTAEQLGRRLYAGLGLGLSGQLRRDAFYVDDSASGALPIHEPWPVSLRAALFFGLML